MRPPPAAEDLGDGVWTIPVPIPDNPLAWTLVYVLEGSGGPVLIDAGWQDPRAWDALCDGLSALGLDVTEVRGVVLTHFHPDHAGLAGRIRAASGAWLAMHRADIELVRFFHELRRDGVNRTLDLVSTRRAGAGQDTGQDTDAGRGRPVEPPAVPDRELADGDLVDLPGRRLRVLWTPGHTPGHICLHLEDGDRIFTGDHVLPRITPHIGLYPYDLPNVDPLSDFLDSLKRIRTIGAAEILPAHQHRFRGLTERTDEIIDHHEERLTEVTGLLSDRPRTLWEIAMAMSWRRSWGSMPPVARQMATGEAAAHLRTLERRRIARRCDDGDTIRFVRG